MRNILAIVAATILALLSGSLADQCAAGSSLIGGNWYCQPVEAIRYMNVGTAGSYKEVIQMNSDGTCKRRAKPFGGPLSPLDEEVSLHFRGPIRLKQLAVYTPSAPKKKVRRAVVPESFNHANKHRQMHQDLKAKQTGKEQGKNDMVTATIDGQIVSWKNNWFGETARAKSRSPDMVTATINGQVVSWENNWLAATQQPAAANNQASRPDAAQVNDRPINVAPAPKLAQPEKETPASKDVPVTKEDSTALAAPSEKAAPSPSSGYKPPPRVGTGGKASSYERIGYYHSATQTLENLVFLGNHGGQGSGVFDYKFGASLSYTNQKGTGGAAGPQILADTTLPSDAEVIVMLGEDCSDGGCGYTRPGSIAHHGFGGADKVFLMEFSMPKDGTAGFNADMPAIWMLNAQIPRTLQYGNSDCSCWTTGCGEFDIAETLSSGSMFMKSTLHTNTPGGDSDYFLRPTSGTMKLAVIFDSSEATVHIQVIPQEYEFPASLTAINIKKLCSDTAANRVSHFNIHS